MITTEEQLLHDATANFGGMEAVPVPPHGRRDSPALTLPLTSVLFFESLP
jgi:hypothetical protein